MRDFNVSPPSSAAGFAQPIGPDEHKMNPDNQINVAFRIIETCFQHAQKQSQDAVVDLTRNVEGLKGSVAKLQSQLRDVEAARLEYMTLSNTLRDENKRLVEFSEKQYRRMKQLELFQATILNASKDVEGNKTPYIDLKSIAPHSVQDQTLSYNTSPMHQPGYDTGIMSPMYRREDPNMRSSSTMMNSTNISTEIGQFNNNTAPTNDTHLGKQFFKKAKNQMNVEQFTSLIGAVKLLNQGLMQPDKMLGRINEYFPDPGNGELKEQFTALLKNRMERSQM